MPTIGGLVIEVAANVARLQKDVDAIRGHLGRLENAQRSHARTSQGILNQLQSGWVGLASKIYLAEQALHLLNRAFSATFGKGIQAVEEYKQGVITASAVTLQVMDISKYKDMGEAWKKARDYAAGMVPVLERVAEETMMTGQQVQMLFTQFAKHGTLLDATNEKAVRGFESMANAVAIMTKGQGVERQIMSEINALMEGQARQGAAIFDMLEKQIPNLKEQLKIWKANGELFENLLPYLKGFDAASGEIRKTWEATKATLQTTANRILREGMLNAFEGMVKLAHELNDWFKKHQEELKETARIFSEVILKTVEKIGKEFWTWSQILKPIFESFTEKGQALNELRNIELQINHFKEKLAKEPSLWDAISGFDRPSAELDLKTLEKRALDIKRKFLTHIKPATPSPTIPPPATMKIFDTEEASKGLKKFLSDSRNEVANAFRLLEEEFWPLKTFADTISDKIRNAYEIVEDKLFDVDAIRKLKDIQEATLQYQLAMIDLKEKEFKISEREALTGRLETYREMLELRKLEYDALVGIEGKELERIATLNKITETLEAINELTLQQKEYQTAWAGVTEGLNEYFIGLQNEFEKTGKTAKDFALKTAHAMQDTFQDFFFDAMTGKLKTLQDYWQSFYNTISKWLSEMLAKWAMVQIFGGAMGLHQGGLVMHTGGIVDSIPKYHSGIDMASDERLAILQTGERVLSRSQNKQYEKESSNQTVIFNNYMTVHATDADSFNSKIMQSKDAIAAAVLAAGITNHPVRRNK